MSLPFQIRTKPGEDTKNVFSEEFDNNKFYDKDLQDVVVCNLKNKASLEKRLEIATLRN